ncbi:hypothetical protein AURDEDRAFT_122360 [Auricularia subglabra TFB-10046 SS5]|nr:hypothetical protein AURDEDRAFT_122360 [Auricularia subglabra TFB-10046 SS5]
MAGLQGLPVIPASSRLGQASLFCERLSLDTLQSHGYLRLPRLLVSTQYNIDIIVTAMLHHAPGLETTLAVCATGCVRVDLRHGESGATASFSTRRCHEDFLRSGMFGAASRLQHVSRLELPAGLIFVNAEPDGSFHYPYIRGEMHLPALRTLVISHSIQGAAALLDPGTVVGTIVAPLLSRIKVTQVPKGWQIGGAIDPDRLAAFIESHIKCNDAAALEVFVDSASGVSLAGGAHGDGAVSFTFPTLSMSVTLPRFEDWLRTLSRDGDPTSTLLAIGFILSNIDTLAVTSDAPTAQSLIDPLAVPETHRPTPHLPPEPVQTLENLCTSLAVSLMPGIARYDDLDFHFAAVEAVVYRALRKAAREWNRIRDSMRVLPLELRSLCWSFLPHSDIARLAMVCSSWRDISRGTPSLWANLAITGKVEDLESVFQRSGQLRLSVAISARSLRDLSHVDHCLRLHANRLLSLRLTVDASSIPAGFAESGLFMYPVPVLEALVLNVRRNGGSDDCLAIPAQLFCSSAPNLRSLTVCGVYFPRSCPALNRLTKLNIVGEVRKLKRMFDVAPGVKQLDVSGSQRWASMPPVPIHSPLSSVTISASGLNSSFANLLSSGYLSLQRLYVSSIMDHDVLVAAAMHHFPGSDTTFTICRRWKIQYLIHRADGGSASFLTHMHINSLRIPNELLRAAGFQYLNRLALPRELSAARYYHLEGTIHLPALHTLVILCGSGNSGLVTVFDPGAVRGALAAPALSRLEILPDPEESGVRTPTRPDHLAQFIEQYLGPGNRARIDVFVDSQCGILLETGDVAGMERLRRSARNLILWTPALSGVHALRHESEHLLQILLREPPWLRLLREPPWLRLLRGGLKLLQDTASLDRTAT